MDDHRTVRKVTRRQFVLGSVAAAAGLTVLSGCGGEKSNGGAASSPARPKKGGTLVIAADQDPATMDNMNEFTTHSFWVFNQMFETMYRVSDDGQKLEPYLARSYEVSDDKLEWTFKLRDDVKFSNGQPMTAEDVQFSIEQASSEEMGWSFINAAIDGVEARDANTVVIKTSHPYAPLLSVVSLFNNAVLPKDWAGETRDKFYENPIGTGPFVWSERQVGRMVEMVRNKNYWQTDEPYLDAVRWETVADDNTRLLMVKGGEANLAAYPSPQQIAQLQKAGGTSDVKPLLFDSTREIFLGFNQAREPFEDVHVRRAISYAIDREALVQAVLLGNGAAARSIFSPSMPFYDGQYGLTYDLAKAKEELAQSSVPNGFSTTVQVYAGNSEYVTTGEIIQQQLKAIGIDVSLSKEDPATADANQHAREFDMALLRWTQDIIDPDEMTSWVLLPESGSEGYFTGYRNPVVEDLVQKASRTFDVDERADLYAEIQRICAEDQFIAPLYTNPFLWAEADDVQGFRVNPTGFYYLNAVWLSS